MICRRDNNCFLIFNNMGGFIIDSYEDSSLYISCISTIERFVSPNTLEWVQKSIRTKDEIFEFSMPVEEAEVLLSFLKENYQFTTDENVNQYSNFSFYPEYGRIWCELLTKDDIKPYDATYLLDDLFTLEFNQQKLHILIDSLERAISLLYKEKGERMK